MSINAVAPYYEAVELNEYCFDAMLNDCVWRADCPPPEGAAPESAHARATYAASAAVAIVEVIGGSRPVSQLIRVLGQREYEAVRMRAALTVRMGLAQPAAPPAKVRRVRLCEVSETATEMTVMIDRSNRTIPVAMRLEVHRQRWRVTALHVG